MKKAKTISATGVLESLFDILWNEYIDRVAYAKTYAELVKSNGGTVQNDHIALRTLNTPTGKQPAGIPAMLRIFEPLGYAIKGHYLFEDKKLKAIHLEHAARPDLPKVFISQLEVDDLPTGAATLIKSQVKDATDPFTKPSQDLLASIASKGALPHEEASQLLEGLAACFRRPWAPPLKEAVVEINKASQYGAWTLLHGNAINHFTAYINAQKVPAWGDIEGTIAALKKAGVPMKKEIEGEKGSKLRQSSTEAVNIPCEIRDQNGKVSSMEWSYAYYELAERKSIPGPDGKPVLFQGFLGAQATNLFEMTRTQQK